MSNPLPSHRASRPAPEIMLFKDACFALGRVHELCGPARVFMALLLAARTSGDILWIRPKWSVEQLLPAGVIEILDPARLLFLNAPREEDILWSMEESLRSGAVSTVISQIASPPALTPIRRLLLAAESGNRRGYKPPLMLVLTPGTGGAQGVETRWHAAPVLKEKHIKWQLSRTKSRLSPVAQWLVGKDDFLP
ncbi:MAG: hypothetical protein L3J33_07060 [Rhodobacteraceae bacterium]|nr:hypothetical protein [Paracoccaceae bacterium]